MSVLTATALKYSLVSAGVLTSSVVPLAYSSGSNTSKIGEKSLQKVITKEEKSSVNKVSEEFISVRSPKPVEAVKTALPKKEEARIQKQTLNELKEKLKKPLEIKTIEENKEVLKVEQKVDLKEQEKVYREFLGSIWNILRSTVWVDEKFGVPWLAQVSTNIPANKLGDIKENLKVNGEGRDSSTVEISITSEDVKTMKMGDQNNLVRDKREAMADLLSRFCYSSDYKKISDKTEDKSILCTFGGVSSSKTKDQKDVNVLTFVRKENEQVYFLDIYFNTNSESHNSLLIQYVSYKDQSWWSSGWYQANGDYGNYRRHIGGNIDKDIRLGHSVTEIDRGLNSMFEGKDTNSATLYKLITSISDCFLDKECAIMFHREEGDYQELAQRTPGISRSDSWDPEKYKYIHPFSRKYWNVAKKVSSNPLIYSQFLDFKVEKNT